MIFKRLNYQTLQSLRLQGYNILLTIGRAEDENPIYFPMKLDSFNSSTSNFESDDADTFQGKKILILDEAIQRSLNHDLNGIIQLDN
ncbi:MULTISPECIES: hypothetical protein [Sphingobacterium]|uniref:hypothetical protein n=1 Tax=Sphingobacterium TaxID=28453 RepID=UPI000B48D379|nr:MULTISPECIES: hypothetical protein [Sphingobacterium]UQA74754.1 hypothetical protein K2F45_23655 [Sphingobacterium siyangense]HAF34960.1 hypothetical protein [Sphingobacterium sp.]HAT93630.1 hypothetical protein [Sphingobacterium sp.]